MTVLFLGPALLAGAAGTASASIAPMPPSPARCAAVGEVAEQLRSDVDTIVDGMGSNPNATAAPASRAFQKATFSLPAAPGATCPADGAASAAVVGSIFGYVGAVNHFAATQTPTVSLVVDPSVSSFVTALQTAAPATFTSVTRSVTPEMRGELLQGKYVLTAATLGL
ncbi:hypothetical protein [Amycolatopsis sp. NBC_01480]|uniref:hypothetical protein n=1 Tax=Amycolatopsis sp. NBC_01480 TaxID=2903562 RepID=UPI002E29D88E|nr:hypothetical protein [Amycolatopsis sp. NBC_01480]